MSDDTEGDWFVEGGYVEPIAYKDDKPVKFNVHISDWGQPVEMDHRQLRKLSDQLRAISDHLSTTAKDIS